MAQAVWPRRTQHPATAWGRDARLVVAFSLRTALSAQVTSHLPLVPLTMKTFAVLLTGALLGPRLGASDADVHRALEREGREDFEQTRLWSRVFELADAAARRPVPRAVLPEIRLHSPKITRALTTEWFARRVDERYRRCLERGG